VQNVCDKVLLIMLSFILANLALGISHFRRSARRRSNHDTAEARKAKNRDRQKVYRSRQRLVVVLC
jgi:hypothetical protein